MSERPYKIIKDDPELTDYLNKLEAELAKAREDVKRVDKLERWLTDGVTYPSKEKAEAFLEALYRLVDIRPAIDGLEETDG